MTHKPGSAGATMDAELNAIRVRVTAAETRIDVLEGGTTAPPASPRLTRLRVSDNKRMLVDATGRPFFWLADTAWAMAMQLTAEEVDLYLDRRQAQGFTVVMFVGFWGQAQSGAASDEKNRYGETVFLDGNPKTPNPAYWDHVAYIVDGLARRGMYAGLLPCWGAHFIAGNKRINGSNAQAFGRWLRDRFAEKTNVVWIQGGDMRGWTMTLGVISVLRKLARGLGGDNLMSFHPTTGKALAVKLIGETWLDFAMAQSGHCPSGMGTKGPSTSDDTWRYAPYVHARKPLKPFIIGEAQYEGIWPCLKSKGGKIDAAQVRQSAWWSVFSGAFGHTYGHNNVWQFCGTPGSRCRFGATKAWKTALDAPGARQMVHLAALMEGRAPWAAAPSLISAPLSGNRRIVACSGAGYALVYTPRGAAFALNTAKLRGAKSTARWLNPRTGKTTSATTFAHGAAKTFKPASALDWVLVIETE